MNQLRAMFIVAAALIFMSMSDCSNKQLTENPPFKTGEAYSQEWVAGVEAGGNGVNLVIQIQEIESGVKIDSVYFRGRRLELATKPGDDNTYVAYLVNPGKADMTMSDEAGAEYGNPVPDLSDKYKLEPDECVIQYQHNGKKAFAKITEIARRPALAYPSAPKNDGN